ncbi:hypothetical protein HJD18_01725 [Thermoleophilia bacterium SCSIO 60948]|nr:hypothetical protein HJD18_01725 [Thermoleophilia bacterium SCSIO 60948]
MRAKVRLTLLSLLALAGLVAFSGAPASGQGGEADPDLGIVFESDGPRIAGFGPVVDLVRGRASWERVQPSCRAIKRGTYDWERTDNVIGNFLATDKPILLTLRGAPPCAAEKAHGDSFQPKREYWDEFAEFARRVMVRYGPGGSVTLASGSLGGGVTELEVWNEPNIRDSWARPDAKVYSKFLAKVSETVRATPQATGVDVLVGGLAAVKAKEFVRDLYKVPGVEDDFDALGLHTYSPTPRESLAIVRTTRAQMNRAGDGDTPIAISEHAWSTCAKPSPNRFRGKCTTVPAQAKKLQGYVNGLRADPSLGVSSFLWYTPQDIAKPSNERRCPTSPKFNYGFFTLEGDPKPSWDVWQSLVGASGPESLGPVGKHRQGGC